MLVILTSGFDGKKNLAKMTAVRAITISPSAHEKIKHKTTCDAALKSFGEMH